MFCLTQADASEATSCHSRLDVQSKLASFKPNKLLLIIIIIICFRFFCCRNRRSRCIKSLLLLLYKSDTTPMQSICCNLSRRDINQINKQTNKQTQTLGSDAPAHQRQQQSMLLSIVGPPIVTRHHRRYISRMLLLLIVPLP